jgi:hypothetical protein
MGIGVRGNSRRRTEVAEMRFLISVAGVFALISEYI